MNPKNISFINEKESKIVNIHYGRSKKIYLGFLVILILFELFLLFRTNFIWGFDHSLIAIVIAFLIFSVFSERITVEKRGSRIFVKKSCFFIPRLSELNSNGSKLVAKRMWAENSYGLMIQNRDLKVMLYSGFMSKFEEGPVFGYFSQANIKKISDFLGLTVEYI